MKIGKANSTAYVFNQDKTKIEGKINIDQKANGVSAGLELSREGRELYRNVLKELGVKSEGPNYEKPSEIVNYVDGSRRLMRDLSSGILKEIRREKGYSDIDDFAGAIMESYAKAYAELVNQYEDPDALEEQLEYLDKAFEYGVRNLTGFVFAQEAKNVRLCGTFDIWTRKWIANPEYTGENFTDEDYHEKVKEFMHKAQNKVKEFLNSNAYTFGWAANEIHKLFQSDDDFRSRTDMLNQNAMSDAAYYSASR